MLIPDHEWGDRTPRIDEAERELDGQGGEEDPGGLSVGGGWIDHWALQTLAQRSPQTAERHSRSTT
ncbi:MAG: hypothetical protein NVS9B1_11860 [Candidatus Dormibacteraceae bacterium]